MKATPKICGGMFGLEGGHFTNEVLPNLLSSSCIYLINGRSAIYIVCDILHPSKVWLPSHLCHTMIKAIPDSISIAFYPIGMDLKISSSDWITSVTKNDLVIFIDYFGFDLHSTSMKAIKDQGAWILQDAAQALLSRFKRPHADFVLYSPRKTLGVPDGGILQSKCGVDLSDIVLTNAPSDYISLIYDAFISRTIFDQTGQGNWFLIYKKAESYNPIGYYRMTDYSFSLLTNGFNYTDISQKRCENYKKLLASIGKYAVINELPDNVVPLGFPACFSNRDELIEKLHNESIYCPIHWPPSSHFITEKFKDSVKLNKQILTLLCDQRIEYQDILKMISIIEGN